jgi:hypothetical protein
MPHKTAKRDNKQIHPEQKLPGSSIPVSHRRGFFESSEDHTDIASPTRKSHHSEVSSAQGDLARSLIARWEARETHSQSKTHASPRPQPRARPRSARAHREQQTHSTLTSPRSPRRSPPLGPGSILESEHHNSKRETETEHKTFTQHQLSEADIATPTPIAPPNHECSWKSRYLALAAEIRQLKAEMSTRASLMSSDILTTSAHGRSRDDDELGLIGVTIILHFRDRDDIVINTDLTQETFPGG